MTILGPLWPKKGFRSDGGKGRFVKGSAKAQVTERLFSVEAIIHPVIVTVGAIFGQHLAPLRPFLAWALPNPSPPGPFLAIRAIFALGGDTPTQPAGTLVPSGIYHATTRAFFTHESSPRLRL